MPKTSVPHTHFDAKLGTIRRPNEPLDELADYFPMPAYQHIHIIVQHPLAGKRAASEEDIYGNLKLSLLHHQMPGDYRCTIQRDSSQNIWDDRPTPDPDIPPVALLYEGFGHFLDIMDAHHDVNVPGLVDVDVRQLEGVLDDLANRMTGSFINEDDRRDAVWYHQKRRP